MKNWTLIFCLVLSVSALAVPGAFGDNSPQSDDDIPTAPENNGTGAVAPAPQPTAEVSAGSPSASATASSPLPEATSASSAAPVTGPSSLPEAPSVPGITPATTPAPVPEALTASGATPAITPSPAPEAPSLSASGQVSSTPTPVVKGYDQAMDLYKQGKYEDAIPLFQQAVSQKPGDYRIYYFLGSAQFKASHFRDAVEALTLSNQLKPDPRLQVFIDRLKAKIATQKTTSVPPTHVITIGAKALSTAPNPYPQLGLRLQPEAYFINLAMFWADAEAHSFYAGNMKVTDPSYQFSNSLPSAFIGYVAEPFLRMNAHLDIGIPLSYLPVGTVSYQVQSSVSGNSSTSYGLSGQVGGLNVRVLAGNAPLQFFASGGPRLASMQVLLNNSSASGSFSDQFNSLSVGAQAQVGVDWEFADNFILSCSGGYLWLHSGHLTGNFLNGLYRLEYDPNSTSGNLISLVPESGPDPQGMVPLDIDLSGPTGSMSLSLVF